MELILIIVLTIFAFVALVAWWVLDIDIADIVASIVSPIVGVCLIYWYGTPLAWAGGIALLAIGGFAIYFLFKRRRRPQV
jgi:lysozyme family protein